MNDRDVPIEMMRFFGFRRASALLGSFALAASLGVPATREGLLHDPRLPIGTATRYRMLADLERFTVYLRGKGLIEDPEAVWRGLRAVGDDG